MRRVHADHALAVALGADEGAGLRAVSVQDVRLQAADERGELRPEQCIGRVRLAADGDAVHAEREPRLHFGERRIGAFAAGEAVGENANLMPAFDLALCEIEDVAKDAADRRAHRMQDSQRIGRNSGHLS